MITETLTHEQLHELKDTLLAERARLERFMPRVVHSNGDGAGDDDDSAVATSAGSEDVYVPRTHTDARHHAVLEALRRLDEGTYGICSVCNGAIPYGRLIVMPESDHCVGCGPRS